MTTALIVIAIVATLAGVHAFVRVTDKKNAEAARSTFQGDAPIEISGASYFHKPWEYGVLDLTAKYGLLTVGPESLVLTARNRKRIGPGLGDSDSGGPVAISVTEATADQPPTYRVKVPRSVIKRIYRPWVNFGVSYQIELNDGTTDQLEIAGDGRKLITGALQHFGYPVT